MPEISKANPRCLRLLLISAAGFALAAEALAQSGDAAKAVPIAIVPVETNAAPGEPATVTGALEVTGGRTMIVASGSVKAGTKTAHVLLPHRGELRVCASTTVKLAADASVPTGGAPGLLLAMDHGALEMSLANSEAAGRDSDVLLTPDFRILVSGPGAAEVKVRLGDKGDTCIDNAGAHAPYVLVSSVFEGGAYRVQAGQRVMFQHGSLHEVVVTEKESCGCPPEARKGNEFPLAQSEGLEPLPKPAESRGDAIAAEPLVHQGEEHAATKLPASPETAAVPTGAAASPAAKKSGFFARVGQFFRKIFGAE